MFIGTSRIMEAGRFDESFFGDCESEDYNYILRELRYRNYRVEINNKHFSVQFNGKVHENQEQEFIAYVEKSRIYRKIKWGDKPEITNFLACLPLS